MTVSTRSALALIAGFGLFALAACGDGGAPVDRAEAGAGSAETATAVVRRGNGAEPDTLDPHKASGQWENNIIGDMFLGLMTEDAAGKPIYGAAESYTVSEDGKTWTFTIREHSWSDGVPVTAHDFVFGFRRILDPATAAQYASLTYAIENAKAVNTGQAAPETLGVTAIDDRTLEIRLSHPASYLPYLLTHYTHFPVPRHVVEAKGNAWTRAGNMVTNGPFVLAEWSPNNYVHLVKNEKFYDAASVAIDEVYFYPTVDTPAAMKRFRAGELDTNSDVPSAQLDWVRQNLGDALRISPFILTSYIVFNTTAAPYDDPRVRNALSMAIDREAIATSIMRAGEVPATSLTPPLIEGYTPPRMDFVGRPMEENVAAARALLAEAGFGPDNPLRFKFNHQNRTETKRIAVALQEMWRQIGAEAELVTSEVQVHYNLLRRQDFEVAWAGWIADFPDAKNYLYLAETRSGEMNYGKYFNPEFDALVIAADEERDPAKRQALLAEAEALLIRDQPMAPVVFGVSRNLVAGHVRGWVDNPVNTHRTRFLSIDRPGS